MDKSQNTAKAASPAASQPANQTSHAQAAYPTPSRESSSTSLRRADGLSSKQVSQASSTTSAGTSSATASPLASREPSPARPSARTGSSKMTSASSSGTRSRKNSQQQDPSPSRSTKSSIPTLTSSQRTLSASTTPNLSPAPSDSTARASASVPQKASLVLPSDPTRDAPRWPVSPRLRSPPPILNKPNLAPPRKTSDQDPPTISLQRSTPSPQSQSEPTPPSDSDAEDVLLLQSGMRTPARGAGANSSILETVQEASPLSSPQQRGLDAALEKLEDSIVSDAGSQPEVAEISVTKSLRPSPTSTTPAAAAAALAQQGESGGESGSIKAGRRSAATGAAPPPLTHRHSSTSRINGMGKAKPGEGSLQTMTVETETVTSIPQVAVAPTGTQASNGSLRTKPSSETIRPKKEKKKSTRKQPTVAPGTASSKADIFEAKVASAVDEANTSDSEETFVYDSNPPEGRDRPQRFHSRTPSATSMASQVDRGGMRSIHSVLEGPGPSVAVKKSMKFVNSLNNSGATGNDGGLGDDESKGTGRSNAAGSGRGTARHNHIGRWGRGGPGNGHPSLFDNESPFPLNAGRSKLAANSAAARQGSGNSGRGLGPNSRRGGFAASLGYDMDDTTTTGADDERNERTPLIQGSMRSGRSARARRHPMSMRTLEHQSYRQPPSFLNRFASCLVLFVMLVLVVSGAIGFMFATSQPLEDIQLVKISSVIASEQELMFDMMVRAHNPNVVVVTVDAGDMEVFAKSPHAGTDSEWWRRPHKDGAFAAEEDTGVSTAADKAPSSDQPDSAPNFLLGTFTEFDNPLSFEGSFFHQGLSSSTSGVRIRRPGNGTDGGSERWERILEDEFDLIVKGVLRYSLPLSQRVRSALIEGRTKVKPNSADNPGLKPNHTEISIS